MKIIIVIVFAAASFLLIGCGSSDPSPTATAIPPTPTINPTATQNEAATQANQEKTFVITKDLTQVYATFGDDQAEVVEYIGHGDTVEPIDGGNQLNCDSFVDGDTTVTLCHVRVLTTGKTGWVLKQWIRVVDG